MQAIAEHGGSVTLPEAPPFFAYADPTKCRADCTLAGFQNVDVRTVEMEWSGTKEQLWDGFYDGTARTGEILTRQEPEALAKIKAAVMARFPESGKVAQPCVLTVAS